MDDRDIREKLDEIIDHLENEEDVRLENHNYKEPEGLGDSVEKVFRKLGITEEWLSEAMGISGCGCAKRKKFLNVIFPYRKNSKDHLKANEKGPPEDDPS